MPPTRARPERLLDGLGRLELALASFVASGRWWLVSAVALLYLVVTCVLAEAKLIWNDELFTVYIAGLPTVADIWTILRTGVEQLPPTFHLLTRLLMRVFGEHPVVVRLPAILGVGAMAICLYVIVSRRASPAYGLIAMILPLATQPPIEQAYSYAYDARPYGLVLAFSAASFLCWQVAAENRRRPLALAGLTATLAAALGSHYYAVLIFIPLAVGEVVRTLRRRRLDPAIWLAFALATVPLWIFLPLIRAGRRLATSFWARPQWINLIDFYQHVLSPAAVPFVAILIVLALYAIARPSPRGGTPPPAVAVPPLHELVAALGYLALPGIAIVMAKLATGAFTDRYALPALVGFALIIPWGLYHLLDRRVTLGLTLAALLAGWFVVKVGIESARQLRQDRANLDAVYRLFRTGVPGDVPIVIASPHAFFQLTYYAPPDLAPRLVYLESPEDAMRYVQTDTPELGLREFRRWTRLQIEPYPAYLSAHPRFVLYTRGPWVWLLPALQARRARLQVVAMDGSLPVFVAATGPDGLAGDSPRRR
jgi:hypothetical protein